jgi:hypothetical protein
MNLQQELRYLTDKPGLMGAWLGAGDSVRGARCTNSDCSACHDGAALFDTRAISVTRYRYKGSEDPDAVGPVTHGHGRIALRARGEPDAVEAAHPVRGRARETDQQETLAPRSGPTPQWRASCYSIGGSRGAGPARTPGTSHGIRNCFIHVRDTLGRHCRWHRDCHRRRSSGLFIPTHRHGPSGAN